MRRLILCTSLMIASPTLADSGTEYLMAGSPVGGFIELVGKSTEWKEQGANLVGVRTGWSIHDYVTLGVEFQTLANPVRTSTAGVESIGVTIYGLHVEGNLYEWRFLGFRSSFSAGSGSAGYRRMIPAVESSTRSEYSEKSLRYGAFDLHMLLHLNVQADVGFGYGILEIKNTNLPGFGEGDLKGGAASVFLRKRW